MELQTQVGFATGSSCHFGSNSGGALSWQLSLVSMVTAARSDFLFVDVDVLDFLRVCRFDPVRLNEDSRNQQLTRCDDDKKLTELRSTLPAVSVADSDYDDISRRRLFRPWDSSR